MHRQSDATSPDSDQAPAGLVLADYLALVWRFKVFVIATAVVAGVTMFAWSMSGPRVYESTVMFAVTQSKIGEGGGQVVVPNTAAFRPIVESLTTAAAVIQKLGLDKPPNNLRPSEFLDHVMSVSEVRGTNLIKVEVVYTDPTLAATIANSIADHAVQTARNVSSTEAGHARDLIQKQMQLALERLDASDARLREYRRQAQVEAVRKDLEARLGGPQLPAVSGGGDGPSGGRNLPLLPSGARSQSGTPQLRVAVENQSSGRIGLLDLQVMIASEKARLDVMDRDLAKGGRVEGLEAAAAATRSNLASLEKQKTELMGTHTLDANTRSVLDHLYEIEGELARRQVEHDLAEQSYMALSQRYQEAILQVIGRSADLEIIDPATPADRPVSRHVVRNTVVGAVAGVCIALAVVLMWHAALVARRRPVPGL